MSAPIMQTILDGLRLRCPACRTGAMGAGPLGVKPQCPNCGVPFEPEEGDFIGAMIVAYAVTAVLVVTGIFLVATFTHLSAEAQLALWSVFGTLFLLLTYRNMKGAWIGLLYAITGLRSGGRD